MEMPLVNVCQGCLSFARELTPIGKHKNLYQELLLTKTHKSSQIKLCWECNKILENIHKFRLKITSAQKVLNSRPLGLRDSLSTLTKVTNANDYLIITEEDKQKTIEVQVEVKREKEELDADHFEINNDDVIVDVETEQKEDLNEILKDEVKSEGEIDFDDIVIDENIKKECDEALVAVGEMRNEVKAGKRKKRAALKMKYKTIIMKDITRKDKRKFYYKVKIDDKTVKEWMEKKRQQTSKKRYQCEMCYCGFSQQKFYDYHIAKRHAKRLGRYECAVCAARFADVRALAAHVRGHYAQFVCRLCGRASRTRGDVYAHLAHGPHARLNECRRCGMRFDCSKRKEFYDHYRQMHMQFICDYCNRRYVKKKKLARHISTVHTEHRCQMCNKSFSTIDSLQKHNKRKHEVDATEHNYCVECNMQFINNAQYTTHIKFSVKHRVNPAIPCPDCGKVYTKKSNMTNHYDLVHRKKTKHYCALCDTYYLNGFRLRYHQKYFHEKRPKPKHKICKYCGKGFSANRILENHVRTHTGERPFACALCAAAFTQKQALTTHVKSAHK